VPTNQQNVLNIARRLPLLKPVAPLGTAFIVTSGTSILKEDLRSLPPHNTITVNRTFEVVDSLHTFMMDDRLVSWVTENKYGSRDRFLRAGMHRVMPSPLSPPSGMKLTFPVEYVTRMLQPSLTSYHGAGIYCGCNSGFGAIQLAIWLGATRIYLLGFDMHAKEGTHYHGGYGDGSTVDYNIQLDLFRKELEAFAPQIAEAGVSVVNLSQGSSLTCFPFKSLKEVL
jgi:hypothetical protein